MRSIRTRSAMTAADGRHGSCAHPHVGLHGAAVCGACACGSRKVQFGVTLRVETVAIACTVHSTQNSFHCGYSTRTPCHAHGAGPSLLKVVVLSFVTAAADRPQ